MKTRCAVAAIAMELVLWSTPAQSDSPPIAPQTHDVYSRSRHFVATVDVERHVTTVFSVGARSGRRARWSYPDAPDVLFLSDDGDHLIVGYPGGNLLAPGWTITQVMLSFVEHGKVTRTVTLGDLAPQSSSLTRTTSHTLWGHYIGFDRNNRFWVETAAKVRIGFDPKTGARTN
jgi:hypothetical protein